MSSPQLPAPLPDPPSHPFRGAVLRGMGVLLPPILTIVIFLWIAGTVDQYVLDPVRIWSEILIGRSIADIRQPEDFPAEQRGKANPVLDGVVYVRLERGSYVPKDVYEVVEQNIGEGNMPKTGPYVYRAYVRQIWLRPHIVIPAFLALFALLMYLLGKFMAAGIGRFFGSLFDSAIRRVPVVRNVYSSVKQVSGFLLNERRMQVSRVVVVEYPRPGVWALGFLIGEGMQEVEKFTGSECVTVLVCTSPMPMAGFTVTVRRSEVVDLNITLDQAIQFIVSCGVVVPNPKSATPIRVAHPNSIPANLHKEA